MLITPQKMVHSVYIAMVFIIFCIVVVKMSSGCATADVEKLEASAVRVEQAAKKIDNAVVALSSVDNRVNNSVDNSTSDDVVNRLAILGVVLLGLSYPVGKIIWIVLGKGGRVIGAACPK